MDLSQLPLTGSVYDRPKFAVVGVGYSKLITSEQTNGQYELLKFVFPKGSGPPRHLHNREDECYYILEGEFEATVGEKTFTISEGEFVHLPRKVPHTIRNLREEMSSFLCWVIPGNMGAFFDRVKKPWPEDAEFAPPLTPEDIHALMEAAKDFDLILFAD